MKAATGGWPWPASGTTRASGRSASTGVEMNARVGSNRDSVPDPDRWQRLQEIFHAAVAVGAPERERLLFEACGGDDALRAQVRRLVAAHERPDGLVEDCLSRPDD